MGMQRILVVGERPEEAKALAFRLGLMGYESAPAASEQTLALRALFAFKPDALILETGENGDDHSLFRLLAQVSQLPVVVLGNASSPDELVSYLEEGAAEYLPRPVSATLLSARLGAILRRRSPEPARGVVRVGNVEIDLEARRVRKRGRVVPLTPTEFRLLQVLAENAGRPCSRNYLLAQVWGEDFSACSHYLRLYIGYLRHKLEDNPHKPRALLTEWGHGYRLVSDGRGPRLPALEPARLAVR